MDRTFKHKMTLYLVMYMILFAFDTQGAHPYPFNK